MTREEAIKEIKSWDFLEGKELEAIGTLIPELKESAEDERIYKEIMEFFKMNEKKICVITNPYPKWIAWLEKQKENLEKQKEQKPVEWSEEDEEMIKMILGDLEWERRNTTVDKDIRLYDEKIAWLKSLRPQPKAELTLLDENIINAAVAFVEQNEHFNCWRGIDKHTVIKALRSLKPSWKPSEEQMGALKECGECKRCIKELYEQLKKLM